MSARALAAAAVALLAAFYHLRAAADLGPPPPAPLPRARTPRPVRAASAPPPVSARNVFEFAPREVPAAAPRAAVAALPSPDAVAPPAVAPPVRFVGFVRRGGALKAALQVYGEAVVLGKGEAAGGYTVTGIDEDGVRLRASDGTTLHLAAGGS